MTKPLDRNSNPATKSVLTDDDATLFDSAMRDVDKFTGKDSNQPALLKPLLPRVVQPAPVKRLAVLPSLLAGESSDVDARTMDRLRRGHLRPEARLDLHGLHQDEAQRALNRFIVRAQSSGVRSVIVITGKGRISEGGGVLRNQAPQWLNAPEIRPRILAFSSAQPRDGGAGALYVLLRRLR